MKALRHEETDFPTQATNMFLAYDTAETAQTARDLVDHVAERLKSELAVHTTLWRFDADAPSLSARKAQEDAANADVMIVAFGGAKKLPDSLMEWLGEWAKHRHIRSAALGVLATGAKEEAAIPAVVQLERLARRYGLDFIYRAQSTSADSMASMILSQPRSQRRTGLEQGNFPNFDVPISEWGIND
jgi:16S rRNA G1207 methylase RsmC